MPGTDALDHARSLFRERRCRNALFSAELFGEPAWDLILTLYIARCEGLDLSIRALSLDLDMSLTDAAKWVHALETLRLIQKGGPGDGDTPPSVCISDAGFNTVTTMLLERPGTMSN